MPSEAKFGALRDFYLAACLAGHIHPAMAACEAVLESAWGTSQLAREANNVFGQKQAESPIYETLILPTRECREGCWTACEARWVKFPTVQACFTARMDLLRRLPRYAPARAARGAEAYIRAVSPVWSTDPGRAGKCLTLYLEHGSCFT